MATQKITWADKVSGDQLAATDVDEVKSVVNAHADAIDSNASAIATNATTIATNAAAIGNKVDKVAGKGLSTNDYTTADKNRLANTGGNNTGDQDISGIATNANAISQEATARQQADTALQNAINGKQAALGFTPENATNRGQASGYASLDATGKVPAAQLPSSSAASFTSLTGAPTDNAALSTALAGKQDAEVFTALGNTTSIAPDFTPFRGSVSATLTGNTTFNTATGKAQKHSLELYLYNNTASAITLTFPSSWVFLGSAAPTSLAAGKNAVLSLKCATGSAETDIRAGYVAQP